MRVFLEQDKIARNIIDWTTFNNRADQTPSSENRNPKLAKLAKQSNFVASKKCPIELRKPFDEATLAINQICDVHLNEYNTKADYKNKIVKNLNIHNTLKDQIIWTKADKGGANVIIDKAQYMENIQNLLNDKNMYQSLIKNPIESLNRKFNKYIGDLLKRDILSQQSYYYINNTNPRVSKFKAYPKIHKSPISYRPLIDSYNSFNYYLAKFLNQILDKYVTNIPKNSQHFKSNLLTLPPHSFSKYLMASIDVVSMYPSINTKEAIDIVTEIYEKDHCKTYPSIDHDELKILLGWACISIFTFNDKYYKQTSGLAMGSPISSLLANIYISQKIEKHDLFNEPNLIYHTRYVDDFFILWSGSELQFKKFVINLNTVCDSLQFTHEFESQGSINFLDTTITRTEEKGFSFSIYQKQYGTTNPIPWHSNHPNSMKLGIFQGYVDRIFKVESNPNNLILQLVSVTINFNIKGYPLHMLINSIYKYIKNRTGIPNKSWINHVEKHHCLDKLPIETPLPARQQPN